MQSTLDRLFAEHNGQKYSFDARCEFARRLSATFQRSASNCSMPIRWSAIIRYRFFPALRWQETSLTCGMVSFLASGTSSTTWTLYSPRRYVDS